MYGGSACFFEEEQAPAGMYGGNPSCFEGKKNLRACTEEIHTFEEKEAPAGMYRGNPCSKNTLSRF